MSFRSRFLLRATLPICVLLSLAQGPNHRLTWSLSPSTG
jgi:hypothetical protein